MYLPILCHAFDLPSVESRSKAFKKLVSEIERLDGEGLPVRKNRPEPWKITTQKLLNELQTATDASSFAKVFRKLDYTYTNLHAQNYAEGKLREAIPPKAYPAVSFARLRFADGTEAFQIFDVAESIPDSPNKPHDEDTVVAINGRPISWWQEQNFIFCKLALKEQCDNDLFYTLSEELLDWNRNLDLFFTLKRNGRIWTVKIPVEIENNNNSTKSTRHKPICSDEYNRYPGYEMVYEGLRACVFQKKDDSSTAILRISSFSYQEFNDTNKNTYAEVEALYPWWVEHATWDHLVVDVISNGGGQEPVPYYQILFTKAFQEQYSRFKKVRELEDEQMRMKLFWGTPKRWPNPHEVWFQKIFKSDTWKNLAWGEFLPTVPMFCASDDCSGEKFSVREHPFRGRISLLVNDTCVSSCDGFVWALKKELQDRVKLYGFPQAADSAFGRAAIHILQQSNPDILEFKIAGEREDPPEGTILTQTVVVTISTDAEGNELAGKPLPLDKRVPKNLDNWNTWHQDVLRTALQDHK